MERFNIISYLDINKLSCRILAFEDKTRYEPVIIMSEDTAESIDKAEGNTYPFCATLPPEKHGYVARFKGCRVFIDPTMKYGDIELR